MEWIVDILSGNPEDNGRYNSPTKTSFLPSGMLLQQLGGAGEAGVRHLEGTCRLASTTLLH